MDEQSRQLRDLTKVLEQELGGFSIYFLISCPRRYKSYEENGKSPSYTECASDLVRLKKEKEFLKEVDSIALQQSLRHLDNAYKNFFRDKKVGYPRFKSKKSHQHSYRAA